MSNQDVQIASIMDELMKTNGFDRETRFYRSTRPGHLTPDEESGETMITANPDPSEAVLDIYRQGHVTLAQHMGPGLAFAGSIDNEWTADDLTRIEVALGDVLDQGGRIYPVESVITETVWYFTLPDGRVRVRASR